MLTEAIEKFRNHLQAEGYAKGTIDRWLSAVQLVFAGHLRVVTPQYAIKRLSGLQPNSARKYWPGIRAFAEHRAQESSAGTGKKRWEQLAGTANPFQNPPRQYRILPADLFRALCASLNEQPAVYRRWFSLVGGVALSPAEPLRLQRGDCQTSARTIREAERTGFLLLVGSRRKRSIPLDTLAKKIPLARDALRSLLAFTRRATMPESYYITHSGGAYKSPRKFYERHWNAHLEPSANVAIRSIPRCVSPAFP